MISAGNLLNRPAAEAKRIWADSERARYDPAHLANHDLGHNPCGGQLLTDAPSGPLRSEALLSEDISKESAEGALSCRMARDAGPKKRVPIGRLVRGCPDDVEAAAQLDIADDVVVPGCQFAKHAEALHPESRFLPVITRANLAGRINAWQAEVIHDA